MSGLFVAITPHDLLMSEVKSLRYLLQTKMWHHLEEPALPWQYYCVLVDK